MVATFLPYLVCLITVRVLNKSRLTVIDGGGGGLVFVLWTLVLSAMHWATWPPQS